MITLLRNPMNNIQAFQETTTPTTKVFHKQNSHTIDKTPHLNYLPLARNRGVCLEATLALKRHFLMLDKLSIRIIKCIYASTKHIIREHSGD